MICRSAACPTAERMRKSRKPLATSSPLARQAPGPSPPVCSPPTDVCEPVFGSAAARLRTPAAARARRPAAGCREASAARRRTPRCTGRGSRTPSGCARTSGPLPGRRRAGRMRGSPRTRSPGRRPRHARADVPAARRDAVWQSSLTVPNRCRGWSPTGDAAGGSSSVASTPPPTTESVAGVATALVIGRIAHARRCAPPRAPPAPWRRSARPPRGSSRRTCGDAWPARR